MSKPYVWDEKRQRDGERTQAHSQPHRVPRATCIPGFRLCSLSPPAAAAAASAGSALGGGVGVSVGTAGDRHAHDQERSMHMRGLNQPVQPEEIVARLARVNALHAEKNAQLQSAERTVRDRVSSQVGVLLMEFSESSTG